MFVMTFTLIRTPHSWPVAQLLLGALGLVRGEGDAGDVVPTTPRWRVRSVTVPVCYCHNHHACYTSAVDVVCLV
jgi:hypothetical protein